MKEHGGVIEVLSELGRGTEVRVCLPVPAQEEPREARSPLNEVTP